MAVGNAARDTQPQTVPLLLAGQAKVRFEYLLKLLLRHARTFIVHSQHKPLCLVHNRQMGLVPILECIVDEVTHTAA